MTVNFPPSPSVNDTYTYNGTTYVFDGVKWVSGGATAYVLVGNETVRSVNTQTGDVVLDSADVGAVPATGGTFGGNVATTGDVQSTSQNGGQLAGFRNQIINGNMGISQRNTGSGLVTSSSSGYKSVDRYAFNSNNTTGRAMDSSLKDYGFYSVLAASRSSGNINVAQMIELPRSNQGGEGREGPFTSGSIWTLSFWADTLPNSATVSFAASSTTTGGNDLIVSTITGASLTILRGPVNGYTQYSKTFTVPAQLSDRATVKGLKVLISWPSNGTEIRTTGWQLEPGPVATPFEHRPIGTELALCQRYFFRTSDEYMYWRGDIQSGKLYGLNAQFPTEMRTAPTVSNIRTGNANGIGSVAQFGTASSQSALFTATATTTGSNAQITAGFDADAEL